MRYIIPNTPEGRRLISLAIKMAMQCRERSENATQQNAAESQGVKSCES